MKRFARRAGWLGCACAWLGLGVLAGCSGPGAEGKPDEGPGAEAGKPAGPPPAAPAAGPRLELVYSLMAETVHLADGVSLWRRGMPKDVYRDFDRRFGLDEPLRKAVKNYAFMRAGLVNRERQKSPALSFEKPFGPSGLFPSPELGLPDRYWQAAVRAREPAELRRALTGVVEPADAEAVVSLLTALGPRAGELANERALMQPELDALRGLLAREPVVKLLEALARLCGLEPASLAFQVFLVGVPADAPAEAWAHGDDLVLELPAGSPIGPAQVAMVVGAVFYRMLARVAPATQVLVTGRFVEAAGARGGDFPLLAGLIDAAGYGLAAPLVAASPAEVPPWPGEPERQKLAEALTPWLRGWLAKGAALDGVFPLEAAKLALAVQPARPSDFVDGAMVVAQETALEPFKAQVTRWVVWKYPPDKKYNYPRMLDENPGRSMLLILTPRDLKELPARFAGQAKVQAALGRALEVLAKKRGVILGVPRESRGFLFVMAAKDPEAMKLVARAFFELAAVPTGVVEID
ncbi:MAG TPA: hypothetical protein PK668_15335 [Myxococcota bacterium]|nr:hypothetical protein [Myxococcota bacterium]HRY94269.1 hypothetical protein [Myxococcota bacterium]HSA24122.1 hypothetical protein [Myxococcota bacterium]